MEGINKEDWNKERKEQDIFIEEKIVQAIAEEYS